MPTFYLSSIHSIPLWQRWPFLILCLFGFAISTVDVKAQSADFSHSPTCSTTINNATDLNLSIDCFNAGSSDQTISLTQDIVVQADLTAIDHSAENTLTINGNGYSISGDEQFRLFQLQNGNAIFNDLTVTLATWIGDPIPLPTNPVYNYRPGSNCGGGLVTSTGTTILINNTQFINNQADLGGGICNNGTMTLRNSLLDGNFASSDGGGIYTTGILTIEDSIIRHNETSTHYTGPGFNINYHYGEGGGIHNTNRLTITHSQIHDNTARQYGGGIYSANEAQETVTLIQNGAIYDNLVGRLDGSGIYSVGELGINQTAVYSNRQGGSGSSQFPNIAGIFSDGTTQINNATISGNVNGIVLAGDSAINNSTIAQNFNTAYGTTRGLRSTGSLKIENSIIAGNTGQPFPQCQNNGANASKTIQYSLIEDGSCDVVSGVANNLTGDPQLEALAVTPPLNAPASTTMTHKPQTNSPVLDAGDNTTCQPTDQRGVARPQNLRCDMGAHEVEDANCESAPHNITTESALNRAIACFNAGSDDATVTLQNDLTLSGQMQSINNHDATLTIDGATHLIDGNRLFRIFNVRAGAAHFRNLTLINGRDTSEDCYVQSCGSAIYFHYGTSGSLTNSTLRGHVARHGGAIWSFGEVSIVDSVIEGNSAEVRGGGIFTWGPLTISNTVLRDNQSGEEGGGIFSFDQLNMASTSLIGNSAETDGGGLYNDGTLILQNSTLSGNSAERNGGGFYNHDARAVINNVTINNNTAASGAGIYSPGEAAITNSIIANSNGGEDCHHFDRVAIANTLIEDGSCNLVDGAYGNIIADPRLEPLANNGGTTQTHMLGDNSPALNAGGDIEACTSADQTGKPRSQRCDLGAVEVGATFSVFIPIVID